MWNNYDTINRSLPDGNGLGVGVCYFFICRHRCLNGTAQTYDLLHGSKIPVVGHFSGDRNIYNHRENVRSLIPAKDVSFAFEF